MSGAVKVATALILLVGAAAMTQPTLSAYSSASGNAGSTFATSASYSACPNQTVTAGYTSGFETGRLGFSADLIVAGAAGAAIDSAVTRTGGYSLRIAAAGAANFARLAPFPAPTAQTARFALRLASLPAANVNQLFTMTNNAGVSASLRYVAATQRLAVAITGTNGGPTTVLPAATTVTAGAWHVVEIRYAVATTTHAVDWQLDEVAQTGTSIAGTATQIMQSNFGTTAAETFTANYDDVLMNFGTAPYPLGDGRVRTLSPNGMGTHVGAGGYLDDDGTVIDAASWQRLDEFPMTSTTDFIQAAAGGTNYAEITFADTTETCIRAANGVFATHTTGTAGNVAKVSVFQGAQETALRNGNLSGATIGQSRDYGKLVVPASTWTQSAVNGLVARFGYASDAAPPPILDSIVVEYEIPQ